MTATTAEKKTRTRKAVATEAPQKDAEETTADQKVKDIEAILPPAGQVTLVGVSCGVRRLKVREFFALMGIMTAGLGPMMGQMGFSQAEDADEFNGMLLGGMLLAIPRQVPEFIAFVKSIVEPHGDKHENREVFEYLDNPEIEDLLPIIDAIIEQEQDHLFELMGKARAYLARWQKTLSKNR